jgi:hypothetical protein
MPLQTPTLFENMKTQTHLEREGDGHVEEGAAGGRVIAAVADARTDASTDPNSIHSKYENSNAPRA